MLTPSSLLSVGALTLALTLPLAAQGPEESRSAVWRAHADSPVRWAPWGEAAFERARAEQKPIFVFVSGFGQQLGRAMRERSFARPELAETLNTHFVCVLLDRDAHPQVAAYLRAYVREVKQVEGWPLNVWLTPELEPFEAASYLPPTDEWGQEGFPNALQRVLEAWQRDPDAQRRKAAEEVAMLAGLQASAPPPPVDREQVVGVLAEATETWLATYDAEHPGFGEIPRRLEPELLRFLLGSDAEAARAAARATLEAVATSPLRDPLDGGFFHYSEDEAWCQPALQKFLSDQARAALAYDEAGLRGPTAGALDYARSMGSSEAGYAAGEDGTAPECVPAYFWTIDEARGILEGADAMPLLERLGFSEEGNVPPDAYSTDTAGLTLPHWTTVEGTPPDAEGLQALRAAREQRAAPPERGHPATSGAHGLLLEALVRAGGAPYAEAAARLATFIQEELVRPDHSLRAGPAFATPAPARDYALVAGGLLAWAETTEDEAARSLAVALMTRANSLFWNRRTGRYMASPEELPAGVAVRVPAGDAEVAMLQVLARHALGDASRRDALAAALVADIAATYRPARGDQLLALQAWADQP